MNIPDGIETIQTIRDKTDTVMLSFSGGKDAVAAWLRMREHFPNIIPYYMYTVPDLEFIDKGMKWYEEYFGTRIIRVPQPSLLGRLNTHTFQSPERVNWFVNSGIEFAKFDRDEIRDMIAEHLKLTPEQHWTGTGVTAHDNIARRMMAHRHGAINHKRKIFYPIIDYTRTRIYDELKKHKIKLPDEYAFLGRSFDGIALEYIHGIRKHYPNDYERLREYYPMMEVEFKRYEFRKQRGL